MYEEKGFQKSTFKKTFMQQNALTKRFITGATFISCLKFILYVVTLTLTVFYYLFFLFLYVCPATNTKKHFSCPFLVTIIFRFELMFLTDLHKIIYYFIIITEW